MFCGFIHMKGRLTCGNALDRCCFAFLGKEPQSMVCVIYRIPFMEGARHGGNISPAGRGGQTAISR